MALKPAIALPPAVCDWWKSAKVDPAGQCTKKEAVMQPTETKRFTPIKVTETSSREDVVEAIFERAGYRTFKGDVLPFTTASKVEACCGVLKKIYKHVANDDSIPAGFISPAVIALINSGNDELFKMVRKYLATGEVPKTRDDGPTPADMITIKAMLEGAGERVTKAIVAGWKRALNTVKGVLPEAGEDYRAYLQTQILLAEAGCHYIKLHDVRKAFAEAFPDVPWKIVHDTDQTTVEDMISQGMPVGTLAKYARLTRDAELPIDMYIVSFSHTNILMAVVDVCDKYYVLDVWEGKE